jgi:hypothetical protein
MTVPARYVPGVLHHRTQLCRFCTASMSRIQAQEIPGGRRQPTLMVHANLCPDAAYTDQHDHPNQSNILQASRR